VLMFPDTHLFAALTHWCWHHLAAFALDGHEIGHATTAIPAVLGVASVVSVALGTARLTRALRRHIAASRAPGPAGSVVVGGREVVVAVVGVRRPRVLVSAGALLKLNDAELAAALAHEHAHIRRRHRYLLVYAAFCGAIARLLPGTRTALDELAFHLERDADWCALAATADPCALAQALRKASPSGPAESISLGGSRIDDRVQEIFQGPRPVARRLCHATAALLLALSLGVASFTPQALAGASHSHTGAVDCDDPPTTTAYPSH